MSETTPEIEGILDELADLCCETLEGEGEGLTQRSRPLLDALARNGYSRKTHPPLQNEIENRVLAKCQEPTIHRRGELAGVTKQVQHDFDELVRWNTKNPQKDSGTRPANISSATDS